MVAQTRFRTYYRGFGADIDINGTVYFAGEGWMPFEFNDTVFVDEARNNAVSYILACDSKQRFQWLTRMIPLRYLMETGSLIRDDSGYVHRYGSHVHYYLPSTSEQIFADQDSLDLHQLVLDKEGHIVSFKRSGIQNNEKYMYVVKDGSNVRYEVSWFDRVTLRGREMYTAPTYGTLVDRTNHLGHIEWTFCLQSVQVSASYPQVIPDNEGGLLLIVGGQQITQIGDSLISRTSPAPQYYVIRLSPKGKLEWIKNLHVTGGNYAGAARDPKGGYIIAVKGRSVMLGSEKYGNDTSTSLLLLHLDNMADVHPMTEVAFKETENSSLLQVLQDGTVILGCQTKDSTFRGSKYSSRSIMLILSPTGEVLNVRDDIPESYSNLVVQPNGMILASGSTMSRLKILDTVVSPPDSLIDLQDQFFVAKSPYDQHSSLNVVSPIKFSSKRDITIHIRALSVSGAPGESVEVQLVVDSVANADLLTLPLAWSAQARWNSSILFPDSIVCQADGEYCKVELSGVWSGTLGTLTTAPALVTLGQTDRGMINIESFTWEPTPLRIRTTTTDGEITVTGLCEDPNVRLLIGTASSFSLAARPNPASTVINIELGLREPLTVSIELINEMGQTVVTFVDGQPYVKGLHLIGGDVSTIATGMYFLRVRSAKGTLTSRLAIVR